MSTEENVCKNSVVTSPSVEFLLKQAYIAHKGKVKALESEIHKLKAELLQEKNNKMECTECKNLQSALKECRENYSKALKEQKQRIKLLEIHLSSLQGFPMFINKQENVVKRNNNASDLHNACKKLKCNNLFNMKSFQSSTSEKCKDFSEDIQLNESIYAPETLNTDVICEFNDIQNEKNPEILETLDISNVKFTLKSKMQNHKSTSAKNVINTTMNSSISLLPNLDILVNKDLNSTATKALHLTDKEITHPEKEGMDILNESESSNNNCTTNMEVMLDPDKEKSDIDIDETYLPLAQSDKENKDLADLDNSMDDITIIDEKISAKIKIEQQIKDDDDEEVQVLLNNNECSFDRLPIKEHKYKYKEECVRKKDERRNLTGHCCKQCKHYYDQLDISDSEKVKRMKNCSRHRSLFDPPQTPEHYWELDFPNTEVCRERGYISRTQKRTLKTHRRHPLQIKQDKTTENSEM